ncbi:hypothetical protein [Desulfosporosinus fructosivorans]
MPYVIRKVLSRAAKTIFHDGGEYAIANNLYKLGVSATARNWKTINKLTALAKAIK